MTVEEFVNIIGQYTLEEYFARFGEIEENLKGIEQNLASCSLEQKRERLEGIAVLTEGGSVFCRLHILSFCMKISGDCSFTERLLREVVSADYNEVGEYNKLSHFWQIGTAVFQNPNLGSVETEQWSARLYMELFRAFMGIFGLSGRSYIPLEERNKDLVFVFTGQVLGMEHAPTKTLLDRCYVLKRILGKEVYIINTAMQIPKKGQAPFYGLVNAEYAESLADLKELEFRGEYFGYYQCRDDMPDLEQIAELIRLIKRRKPLYLIDIGGSDICADLCGLFVPQITISTVFSKLSTSCGEYQIVDKELGEDDRKVLAIMGVQPEKVKRTRFTFSFKEQTHHFTREAIGLPQDKFILLVVGWRLDEEVNHEFMQMLERVVIEQQDIAVAFMGVFDSCQKQMGTFPMLQEHVFYLGKQMDALAVVECCNLYVNPRRNGGGSSVSEALYKGLPAVTLPIGDVSVAAGDGFWVNDYEAMEQQILKYCQNQDYYNEMSQKARKRAEQLLDSGTAFGEVMRKIEAEIS